VNALPPESFHHSDARCFTHSIESGSWSRVLDEVHVYDYALGRSQGVEDMRQP
jgi:hypothetical protein